MSSILCVFLLVAQWPPKPHFGPSSAVGFEQPNSSLQESLLLIGTHNNVIDLWANHYAGRTCCCVYQACRAGVIPPELHGVVGPGKAHHFHEEHWESGNQGKARGLWEVVERLVLAVADQSVD